jgi:hypothetical protein
VPAPTQHDLSEYVAVNKTTALAGDSLTVDAYNMNLGNGVAASPTTAGIYISTDATITTSDTLLTTISTSSTLATVSQPGYYDHQTVTVTLPGNLAPGTYYIGGLADYNNHLAETSETNNAYNVVQVTVAAASSPAAAQASVHDNFALLPAANAPSPGGTVGADYAQAAEWASGFAAQSLAAATEPVPTHSALDNLADLPQHHLSDYHLV